MALYAEDRAKILADQSLARAVHVYRNRSSINYTLREKKLDNKELPFNRLEMHEGRLVIDQDNAIKAGTLKHDTVLWRAVSTGFDDFKNLQPGYIYSDHAYISTSISEEAANDIAVQVEKILDIPAVKMKILAPAGHHAAYVSNIGSAPDWSYAEVSDKADPYSNQREMMLGRNERFEVLSNDGKIITVRLLGEDEKVDTPAPAIATPAKAAEPVGTWTGIPLPKNTVEYLEDDHALKSAWTGPAGAKKIGSYRASANQIKAQKPDETPWWDTAIENRSGALTPYGVATKIMSQAVHSEPTTEPLHRGLRMRSPDLQEWKPGASFSMGLSSFSAYEDHALSFAHNPSINSRGNKAVVITLEPGAKVAAVNRVDHANHKPSAGFSTTDEGESVAFGQFEVISKTRDKEGVIHVLVRQTTLMEA